MTTTAPGTVTLLDAARRALRTGEDSRRPTAPAAPLQAAEYPVRRPRDVLPHPRNLDCMVAWDTETSGLYTDDGARTAVISVAFSRKATPDVIEAYGFPFDQGRPADKGFRPVRDKRRELRANAHVDVMDWHPGDPAPPGFLVRDPGGRNARLAIDLKVWAESPNLGETDWADINRWLALAGEHVGLVGHNAKFDMHHTRVGTRQHPGVDLDEYLAWDTQLGAAVLWPLELMGLKETAARLWGKEAAEEKGIVRNSLIINRKLWGLGSEDGPRYDLLPWCIIGPYATQDAVLTLRLAKLETQMFADGEANWREIERHLDLTRILYRLERRGFGPLDLERTRVVAEAIEHRIAQLEGAMPFDPPTTYKAKEYFFDDLGLRPWKGAEEPRVIEYVDGKRGPVKKVVKQGALTIDIATRMAAQGVPFSADFAEMVRLRTANNMQYRGYLNLAGSDDRLRTNFKQAFVRSGRMSVERFQAQAIPRRDSIKIAELPTLDGPVPHPRDLFLVPDGRTRVNIDLSQAELRVAAKFSDCKLMIEQLESGRDIHGETTTQIFGYEPGDPEFSHHRYIAKRGVFGGVFMVGPKTFQETIWKLAGIDLEFSVCKQTISGFRALYPEIEKAYNEWDRFAEEHGYVELVDGTRSWFGPRDFSNTAWNRRVQGSLALFNMDWLTYVERRTAEWDSLVLTVHDSVTLDLPHDQVESVCADIKAWTADHFQETFGIVGGCDVEIGW